MPISKDELHFVNMTTLPDVQWDFTMGIDINMQAIAKEYFAKALKQKLNDAEEKLLTETITEPKVVKSIGMDVNFLPQLTELNTKVAVAVMAAMSAVPAQFKEYLDKLLTMDVSLLHSFELLNSLLSLKIEIPKDYLRTFVKHSIETIGKLKGQKEKLHRQVRLFAVFVKSLIKNNHLNPRELDTFVSLQAFCIEHTAVAEANSLFNNLKSLE
eukprot:TRINITY_DN5986_c0_g1_i3.p1 TRINITY_DN5986_c0_g1~~TRINITY_DN5986_c0_g1_i3.p1  ORF type:complete len:213 (-),score=48.63 TRINITY_DN5986_c0_g1_i3:129-767(-)